MGKEYDKSLFANALRDRRKQLKMSVEKVADELDKSKTSIEQMEGRRRFTSIPAMLDICNLYGITPDYLLGGYLDKAKGNLSQNDYDELMSLLVEMKPNELKIIKGMIKLLSENRD